MLLVMRHYDIHAEARQAQPTMAATTTLPVEEIGPWLAKTYGAVASVLAAHSAGPSGPPFARYHRLADGRFVIEAGFPVSAVTEGAGDVQPAELPGGSVAITVHTGPYDQMEQAYEALASWVSRHGGELAGDAWEVYFSDPAQQPDPATWRTQIVQPYRPV